MVDVIIKRGFCLGIVAYIVDVLVVFCLGLSERWDGVGGKVFVRSLVRSFVKVAFCVWWLVGYIVIVVGFIENI